MHYPACAIASIISNYSTHRVEESFDMFLFLIDLCLDSATPNF